MLLRKDVLTLSCCLAVVICGGTLALAAEEDIEEISVVGSRGHERSAADLAVPVDVLGSSEFAQAGRFPDGIHAVQDCPVVQCELGANQ